MIYQYPIENLILKTKFKYHEKYKQNILKYFEEDSPPPSKDKHNIEDSFLKYDWLKGRDWERPWVKYAASGINEHLVMFANELGYEKIHIQNLWYQQYGYKDLHDWHIHGGNYTGVYYLEHDKTCPLTEFVSSTNLEKIFKAIEELQPKSSYKLTTHQSNAELVDEALFNNIVWNSSNSLTWTQVKNKMDTY